MTTKAFSKGEAIRFGWAAMKANIGFFIGLLIVVGLISYSPDTVLRLARVEAPGVILIVGVASFALQQWMGMGVTRISLKFADGARAEMGDLFARADLFFKYVGGSILYALIVLGGLILLIVPGFIWAMKYQFYGYFIMDRELGPIEALKQSAAITGGAKGNLFLFALVLAGINMLGALALVIGLFATIPTSIVAVGFVYRRLLARAAAGPAPVTA